MGNRTVLIGMSGGIDSTATAMRLQEAGYCVHGLFLELHTHADPAADARLDRISKALGITVDRCDLRDLFSRQIIDTFVREYRSGKTPNPCVICNERVKFKALVDTARAMRAPFVATGHYARILCDEGRPALYRGLDPNKDQSYVLYRLPLEWLPSILFPLGTTSKDDNVRLVASRFGSLFEGIPESSDLCFLPQGHRSILTGTEQPGAIIDLRGNFLGHHRGLSWYTIGQRKGLGLPGGPWYVLELDSKNNKVIVGTREELNVDFIKVTSALWHDIPLETRAYQAQYRYRCEAVPVRLSLRKDDPSFTATPLAPVTGVAPGQSLVVYSGERVLGGGFIEKTGRR